MESFLRCFRHLVLGVLCGFDRLRLRGSKRLLCSSGGMANYLVQSNVRFDQFAAHSTALTAALCMTIEKPAKQAKLFEYLNSSKINKEETALEKARQQGIREGLIAVLASVEPCQTMRIRHDAKEKRPTFRSEVGKCLHYYHYYLDKDFGLRYTRLQSWFPFTMHVGINGREWLGQQLTHAGVRFTKKDNCFTWVEDWQKAQELLDAQTQTDWTPLLDRWALQSYPEAERFLASPVPYYWAVQEGEYATDIVFKDPAELAKLYQRLVAYCWQSLSSTDVLRYMGYKVCQDGRAPKSMAGQVVSTFKELVEGMCVKHHYRDNLLKMYDKFQEMLRLENMLAMVRDFKILRTKENDPQGPKERRYMRKGMADFAARAELGRQINDRLAEALANVEETMPLAELAGDLSERKKWQGRSVRALNPMSADDTLLLETINRGDYLLQGFRNQDIREQLYGVAATAAEQKRQASKVTRLLRMLRAHGLIRKEPRSHRYQTTPEGRQKITALLAARAANVKHLLQAA